MTRRRSGYPPTPHFVENGVIEQRVSQVEDQFSSFQRQTREDAASLRKEISTQIGALSEDIKDQQRKITEKGNVNWIAFGTLMVGLFVASMTAVGYGAGILKEPIEKAIARNAADIADIKASVLTRQETEGRFVIVNRDIDRTMAGLVKIADTTATKSELEQRFITTGKQRDEAFKNLDARLERAERDQAEVAKSVVSRGEHEQRWRVLEQRDGDLQRQVDSVQRAFGDTFSLRDALAQMQRRIDALEAQKVVRTP